jgi:hypothetical protein
MEIEMEIDEAETKTEDETVYYLPYSDVGLGSGEI